MCSRSRSRRGTVRGPSLTWPRGASPYLASPIGPWWCTPGARRNGASSIESVRSKRQSRRWRPPREAARQEYVCHADAEAAAAKLRALQSAYHWGEGAVAAHPKDGPGGPSVKQPRVIQALRYGLQVTLHERSEVMARKRQEPSCCVLLPQVPAVGERAQLARAVLQAAKEQHGIEQHYGFLQDPLIVNRLF